METTGINKYETRRARKQERMEQEGEGKHQNRVVQHDPHERSTASRKRTTASSQRSVYIPSPGGRNIHQQLQNAPNGASNPIHTTEAVGKKNPQCPVTCEGLPDLVQRTISDEHFNISALLSAYAGENKKATLPKEGTTVSKIIDITTGTRNEERAVNFGKALQQLLGISTTEIETSVNCAKVLHVNTAGAFGVYCLHNTTKEHGHMQGVLNLLLSGTKTWHMRPPGPRGSSTCITTIIQEAGQLLWLPPGWYHEVKTTGYGPELPRPRDLPRDCINSGSEIRVAHAFTVWCLPEELCEYALCSYACGASEERQKPDTSMSTPAERTALYTLLACPLPKAQ